MELTDELLDGRDRLFEVGRPGVHFHPVARGNEDGFLDLLAGLQLQDRRSQVALIEVDPLTDLQRGPLMTDSGDEEVHRTPSQMQNVRDEHADESDD